MKSRVFKKFVSLLLVLVFSTQLVTPALAAVIQNEDGSLVLTDENGNVIEKDWEAEFPYGTFVFENSQLTTAEGDGEKSIKIYRWRHGRQGRHYRDSGSRSLPDG